MSWCRPLCTHLLWDSTLPWLIIFFTTLGKFSVVFKNMFSISFSLSSPSGAPMMLMLVPLKLSRRLFTLFSFFGYFFFSDCIFFASLYSKSMIWFFFSSTLLLTPYKLLLISVSVSFFLTGIFLWFPWVFFLYAVEVLTKFNEYPYNQCFVLSI